MLHIRVVTPAHCSDSLVEALHKNAGVINIVRWPDAARRPDGDLIQFDVAREAANDVIALLRSFRLEHEGSIAIERIDTAFSDIAAGAEAASPGDPSEAVIWEEVEARIRDESSLSTSFVALVVIAVLIAGIGILTDSAILIVGAMVVGPEYGPLSSIALGLHKRRPARVARGVKAIAVSFPLAIVAALAMSAALKATGQTPDAYRNGVRPLTQFISEPDIFSVLVALLAAVAGTLSLTEAKAGTLVGVLVSVTTIPAAANIGVALAYGRGSEALGALAQLMVNLVAIVLIGAATLRLQWKALRSQRAG